MIVKPEESVGHILKHGSHDQSSHGRRDGKSTSNVPKEIEKDVIAVRASLSEQGSIFNIPGAKLISSKIGVEIGDNPETRIAKHYLDKIGVSFEHNSGYSKLSGKVTNFSNNWENVDKIASGLEKQGFAIKKPSIQTTREMRDWV